jgi:hypothetical protein
LARKLTLTASRSSAQNQYQQLVKQNKLITSGLTRCSIPIPLVMFYRLCQSLSFLWID